jgi:hypothetical protein
MTRAEAKAERLVNEAVLERKLSKGVGILTLLISVIEFVVDLIAFFAKRGEKAGDKNLRDINKEIDKYKKIKARRALKPAEKKVWNKLIKAKKTIKRK